MTKVLISGVLVVLIVKLLSNFRHRFPSKKQIEELRDRIKAEVEEQIGDARKAGIIAERTIRDEITSEIGFGFWFRILPAMFLMVCLFYIIGRIIQFFVIGTGNYIIVDTWPAFGLPICFLVVALGVVFLEPLVGKPFVLKKVGQEKGEEYYQAYTKVGPTGYKLGLIILFLIGIIALAMTSFCVYHYAKIAENGLYINPWFSYEEKFYSWDMIDKVYFKKGHISRKTKAYTPCPACYVFIMNDGTEWDINQDKIEVNDLRKEAIDFLLTKSNVSAEEKVWNAVIGEYVDYPGRHF